MTYQRIDNRTLDQLRQTKITPNFLPYAEGSALIEVGNTKVICAATVEEKVPPFLRNKGVGWVTAEYAMLPRATNTRTNRETLRPSGRTQEIQRLIGRSLRAVVDTSILGERQIMIDCDVLQADGGTRTASITGAYVALADAVAWAVQNKHVPAGTVVLRDSVAAVSVGIVDGLPVLDLPYVEDVRAETDMNVVVTGSGTFVEVQGTAEHAPFDRAELDALLDLAVGGTAELAKIQQDALAQEL